MESIEPHQKAYVCIHVFDGSARVLLVSRPEGDWCFLCGIMHEDSPSEYRVVGMGHLFDNDQTLKEIQDLSVDWEAERPDFGEQWIRTKITPDG
jgi:hypothetical protein